MECRLLFDLPPHIPYKENDQDGKNASGIPAGGGPEGGGRPGRVEIKLKS